MKEEGTNEPTGADVMQYTERMYIYTKNSRGLLIPINNILNKSLFFGVHKAPGNKKNNNFKKLV